LYKQALEGDVQGKRPGFSDIIARAKYNAWAKLKGTSAQEAMQRYVDVVEGLR
jgi:acyl-CoA-binding protein